MPARSVPATPVLAALALLLAAGLPAAWPAPALAAAADVKPAPKDWLAGLSDFSGGPAPTTDTLKGQVVLILTWTSYHPPSVQALARAGRLAEAHAKDGLIVIAAHRADRFDNAAKVATDRGYKGLLAKDTGSLRSALAAESDPKFFLIDRAGNLRASNLSGDAVESALTPLLAETADAASKSAAPAQAKGPSRPAVVTRELASSEQAGRSRTAVPFTPPPDSAYAAAAWPAKNEGKNSVQGVDLGLGGDDHQGKPLPGFSDLLNTGYWVTPKPASLAGKVTIIYIWTPAELPGYRFTPQVDEVQRNNLDDVAILAYTGADLLGGGSRDRKVKQVEVERWLRENRTDLAYSWDEANRVASALGTSQFPQVYVVSSDGTVRWQGHPIDKEFRKALDLTISVDPGVRARRAAEAAALKGQPKP